MVKIMGIPRKDWQSWRLGQSVEQRLDQWKMGRYGDTKTTKLFTHSTQAPSYHKLPNEWKICTWAGYSERGILTGAGYSEMGMLTARGIKCPEPKYRGHFFETKFWDFDWISMNVKTFETWGSMERTETNIKTFSMVV